MRSRKRSFFWGAYTVSGLDYIYNNQKMTLAAFRILIFLINKMSYSGTGNKVFITQKDMCKCIDLSKATVSKGIKILIQEQYIVKITSGFMVNPYFFYIGLSSSDDRYEIRHNFDQLITENSDEPKFGIDEESGEVYYKKNIQYDKF